MVQVIGGDSRHDVARYDVIDSVTSEAMTQQCDDVIVTPAAECQLTSVPGYIVYSACGSFWVPMLGMIVFYWKIYKTAVAATEAVNRGFVEQKTSGLLANLTTNADSATWRLTITV